MHTSVNPHTSPHAHTIQFLRITGSNAAFFSVVENIEAHMLYACLGNLSSYVAVWRSLYGVVPKGLLTFLGSLYKVAKTTSGTLVYRFERQTTRFVFLPSKNTMSSAYNIGFYLRNLQIAAFCIWCHISWKVSWRRYQSTVGDVWMLLIIETVEALETRYSIILSGSNVIF